MTLVPSCTAMELPVTLFPACNAAYSFCRNATCVAKMDDRIRRYNLRPKFRRKSMTFSLKVFF